MKSKNLILMMVAVGCGLVASVVYSKVLSGQQSEAPDLVEVIVAKREMPVGTVIEEKDFNDILARQAFPRATVPPEVITEAEALKGKRVSRTLRAGNFFVPADISSMAGIALPAGMMHYTIKTDPVRAAAGFIMPGSKVDVLALIKLKNDQSKVTSKRILVDMLVVAVDIMDRRPEGGGPAIPQMQSVSLAVHPRDAKLLHTAEAGGGDIRLVLRPEGFKSTDDDRPDLLVDEERPTQQPAPQAPKGPELVPTVVAKKKLTSNTRFEESSIEDQLEVKMFPAPALENGIQTVSTLKNKYLLVDVPAGFPVLGTVVADAPKPEKTEEPTRIVVKTEPVGPEAIVITPREIVPPKPQVFRHQLTIEGPGGSRTINYEGTKENELKITRQLTEGAEVVSPKAKGPSVGTVEGN
jgi:pilus assembly protein CpaB